MSTVNGYGNTANYGKFQEVAGAGAARGARAPQRGSVIGNGRPSRADDAQQIKAPKERRNDTLKEIATLLKGLIETISAMISKLMGSVSSSAEAQTGAGTGTGAGAGAGSSSTGGTNSSGPTTATTTGSASGSDTNSGAGATAGSGTGASPGGSSTGNTTTTGAAGGTNAPSSTTGAEASSSTTGGVSTTGTATTGVTSTPTDDLETRESSSVSTTATTQAATETEDAGLQALKDETGAISVVTPDGFTVRAEGKDQAWTIMGPDGFKTRIWGDPHVSESDGDTWDFLEQSTFKFGKNKVTVEVVPAGNGATYSARITIYNGKDRVTISGINSDKPTIDAVARDGVQHDAQLSDGTIIDRGVNTRGESWSKTVDGKKDVMGH